MRSLITFISNIFSILQLPVGFWRKLVLFGLATFFIYFGLDHFINVIMMDTTGDVIWTKNFQTKLKLFIIVLIKLRDK